MNIEEEDFQSDINKCIEILRKYGDVGYNIEVIPTDFPELQNPNSIIYKISVLK
jgi:biotin operon repressor